MSECLASQDIFVATRREMNESLPCSTSTMKNSTRNDSTSTSYSHHRGLLDHVDPQSFLSEGNKHFIYKRYTSAIASYTEGLSCFKLEVEAEVRQYHCDNVENAPRNDDTDTKVNGKANQFDASTSVLLELLSNRALTYLSIENHVAALQDTQRILAIYPTHFKGVIRHAKALAGLRRYEGGINFLNNSVKLFAAQTKTSQTTPENIRELASVVEKIKRMKHQSETGDFYDMPQIMDKLYEPSPPDWVDYTGPVKVVSVEGKGRGLVAAQDLPAGKLICACRAFEIIFLGENGDPELGISEDSKKALNEGQFKIEDDPTLNLLARKIYDRLIRNPEKRSEFYQLHAGNELGHLKPTSEGATVHPLDMARIYGICRTNAFANSGDSYPEVEKSVGLWIFPAYINHKCIGGNSTWKIFSDFLFIRTFRPVKKGEELLVSYVSPAFPFKARTEVLTKRLGFVCSCLLCELDRTISQDAQDEKDRLKLLVQNQEVKFAQLDPSKGTEAEYAKKVQASVLLLEQIILKLEKIQPKHGMYNASLLDPLQKLGLKYFGMGEFQKMTKIMERACGLMKCCMLPHGIADCSMWIVAAYMQLGNFKLARKWGKVLRDNLILAYGDVHVLKVLGPWIIEPMTKWGLLS